jgi:3-hydroxyacyl-CoA dehydrogenase
MELIVSGRHVGADEAKRLGIIDAIVEGRDLRAEAIAYAKSIATTRPLPRVRDKTDRLAEAQADAGMFESMRKSIARKARNQKAPYHCISAVEAATQEPFEQGMQTELRLFAELENADEARALRYAFFAEREVTKIPGLDASLPLPELKKIAVVGAGTMGGGIAMSFADFGVSVKILEATPEAMARGLQRIRDNYGVSVKRGSVAQAEVDRRIPRIVPVDRYEDIADCDVVVEAVYEEMPVKKEVFARLDAVMKPEALLLTNSSALDIDELAATTRRPSQVAGAHFFSPANVMKLLEVVAGKASAPTTVAAAMKLGRAIGKISVWAGNTDGFVANRSRAPFNTEMVLMVEEGAQPEEVDKVMVDFGYPMGPFAVGDLAGLDIGAASRRRRAAADPNYRKLPIPDRLVEMGRYGQKTGAGWYRYEKGDRTPHPDPVTKQVIREAAQALSIPQRTFTAEEILRRLLFASLNEACKILEEGKALRASDVDVMWLHGFGFPRYRGGLMFWADGIGSKAVYDQIEAWHQRYGDRWKPAGLLKDVAARGGLFREVVGKQ